MSEVLYLHQFFTKYMFNAHILEYRFARCDRRLSKIIDINAFFGNLKKIIQFEALYLHQTFTNCLKKYQTYLQHSIYPIICNIVYYGEVCCRSIKIKNKPLYSFMGTSVQFFSYMIGMHFLFWTDSCLCLVDLSLEPFFQKLQNYKDSRSTVVILKKQKSAINK